MAAGRGGEVGAEVLVRLVVSISVVAKGVRCLTGETETAETGETDDELQCD